MDPRSWQLYCSDHYSASIEQNGLNVVWCVTWFRRMSLYTDREICNFLNWPVGCIIFKNMTFLTFLVVISFLKRRKVELEVKKKQIFCQHYGLGDLVSIVARLQARKLTVGLSMNDITQMRHKIDLTPLSHFVTKVHLPPSQTYAPPFQSQKKINCL